MPEATHWDSASAGHLEDAGDLVVSGRDLWIQYAELGGPTSAVPGALGLSAIDLQLNGKAINTGLAPGYLTALQVLDGDMPQYIADNTDDEISHHRFLNNSLQSK